MSSSNEVDIIYAPELTTYGVVDPGTNFETVRKVNESLSGTPEINESSEARKDRQSGGQVLVGVEVGGGIGFELSASKCFDDFLEAGMMKTWVAKSITAVDMTIDTVGATATRAAGDFTADVSANTFVTFSGFANSENNTTVFVTNVSALEITFIGPADMVDEAGLGTSYIIPKQTSIGTTRKSFTIEKQFTDLTKFISYTGMRVGAFSLETQVGQPVSGEFTFGGADYDTPSVSISNGETVNAAGSAQIINSTVDMGVLVIDGAAVPYCVEGVKIALNNNLAAQKCISQVGPLDQIPFEAAVSIELTAHLAAANFDLLADKIAQTPIAMGFNLRDPNGLGYAVFLPRVQVSFPDPSMTGKNTHVMINASGTASYDSTAQNTMFLYRLED